MVPSDGITGLPIIDGLKAVQALYGLPPPHLPQRRLGPLGDLPSSRPATTYRGFPMARSRQIGTQDTEHPSFSHHDVIASLQL